MEKKISMNDIVAFIEKAMKNNMLIKVYKEEIEVIKDDDNFMQITRIYNDKNIPQWIRLNYKGNCYPIEFDSFDFSTFEYLKARAQQYSKNKTLEYFNNFFDEENKVKEITINDLDNEDD